VQVAAQVLAAAAQVLVAAQVVAAAAAQVVAAAAAQVAAAQAAAQVLVVAQVVAAQAAAQAAAQVVAAQAAAQVVAAQAAAQVVAQVLVSVKTVKESKMKSIVLGTLSAASIFGATMLEAQSTGGTASQSWSSSYKTPTAVERNVRLNFVVEQQKLKNGFYQAPVTIVNTTNNNSYSYSYDHRISNSISAAEGAMVDLENRSAEGSGTSTTVIGAVNTSTNNITSSGVQNSIDIANTADSEAGCIEGGITSSSNRPVGGIDISSGAAGAGAGAGGNSFTVSPRTCQ
jgi:hypothetical protein